MISAERRLEKGDTRSNVALCLIRGDRLFLKRFQGTPYSAKPHDARPLPAPVPAHPALESFFIGDTLSSEDDLFGWGGNADQDHHITSDQELSCSPDEHMDQSALLDLACPLLPVEISRRLRWIQLAVRRQAWPEAILE